MCGIIGYVGSREAAPILIDGLRKLEYRGYDCAGVAVTNGAASEVIRCRGKLADLEQRLAAHALHGSMGIGLTRWATQRHPSDQNAQPHKAGRVAVVHHGLIENHLQLRQGLERVGRRFVSETDGELVAHLIDQALSLGAPGLVEAVRCALTQLRGTYALVVLSDEDRQRIVAAKNASPLVIGIGRGEMFVASDAPAILQHTQEVVFLQEGEIAEITRDAFHLTSLDGRPVHRPPHTLDWEAGQTERGGYRHFMLKEINEQPRAVADTLRGRLDLDDGDAYFGSFIFHPEKIRRVLFLGCGTSHHAGLIGRFLVEATSRVRCEVDLASEFRYRDPVVGPGDLVVGLSQSGETADTLAAVLEARHRGAQVLAICNTVDSAIPRASDAAIYTQAGPEIGVASTKTFTSQLAALALLAVHIGHRSSGDGPQRARALATGLGQIAPAMQAALAMPGGMAAVVEELAAVRDVLFLGRGPNHPIALEGALKLKEISYLHAEGHAAGEMKHGPIALIDASVPAVVIAPQGPGYHKVLSNLAEVKARQGRIVAVATAGDKLVESLADQVLWIPDATSLLQPLLTVLPLQLLSYGIAVARGNHVDEPRNLAKSVTVE